MNQEMLTAMMECIITDRPTLLIKLGSPTEANSNGTRYTSSPMLVTMFTPREVKPFIPLGGFPTKSLAMHSSVGHPSVTTKCLKLNALADLISHHSDSRDWMIEAIQNKARRDLEQTRFNEVWDMTFEPLPLVPKFIADGKLMAFNLTNIPLNKLNEF